MTFSGGRPALPGPERTVILSLNVLKVLTFPLFLVQSQCSSRGSYLSFIAASQGPWGSGKGATASGGPDAERGNEAGAPHVGFTCAVFELVVPSFHPLTGSFAMV